MTDTLPLWPLAPNWVEPVVERLEFQTDVLTGVLGHEQARAVRPLPRRSIEASFTPCDAERSFAMLALQRKGASQWRVPLWFDSTRLTATAASGATTLYLATTGREYRAGDYAYLPGADPFAGELVEIATVLSDRITLVTATTAAHPAGSKIHPCRPAWLDANSLGGITSRVASFNARFVIDTDTAYAEASDPPAYRGHPLLVQSPNWAEQVELEFEQRFEEFDPGQGPRVRIDPAARAFAMTRYSLLLDGISEVASFRSLAYRLRGRQRPMWVPTYGMDMVTASPWDEGEGKIEVNKIGLGLLGGITPDIADILIGGDEAIRVSHLGTASSPARERLLLTTNLSRNIAAGERVSLLQLARLEQDVISISHVTDTVATTRLSWKSFTDGRDGSAAGDWPIPTATMGTEACGVPLPGGVILDFKNGVYTVNGVSKTFGECVTNVYSGVVSPGVGWTFENSENSATVPGVSPDLSIYTNAHGELTPEIAAPLLGGYVVVIDWAYNWVDDPNGSIAADVVLQAPLENLPFIAVELFYGLQYAISGDLLHYTRVVSGDDVEFNNHLSINTVSGGRARSAVRVLPGISAAMNGGSIVTGTGTPTSFVPTTILFGVSRSDISQGGGVYHFGGESVIEKLTFYPTADITNAELPGLSAP